MADAKVIHEAELIALLESPATVDETLATYFEPTGLSAELDLRDNVTVIDETGYEIKGLKDKIASAGLALANRVSTNSRQSRYADVVREQPDLPRAVAEGDSWFLHPLVEDTVDHLFPKENPRLALLSFAGAGDDLAKMWRQNQFIQAAVDHESRFALLSGGGNDILGETFNTMVHDWFEDRDDVGVARLLTKNFDRKIQHLAGMYRTIAKDLAKHAPDCKLVVHCYDYIRPGVDDPDEKKHQRKGKWVGKVLDERGINNEADRQALMCCVIDRFADDILVPLADRDNVIFVDTRDAVGTSEWYDEIHPDRSGFSAVAVRFYEALGV